MLPGTRSCCPHTGNSLALRMQPCLLRTDVFPTQASGGYEAGIVKAVLRLSAESVHSFRVSLKGFPGLSEILGILPE